MSLKSSAGAKLQDDRLKGVRMVYFYSNYYLSMVVFNVFSNKNQIFRMEDTIEVTEYHINFSTGELICNSATSNRHSIDNIYIIN